MRAWLVLACMVPLAGCFSSPLEVSCGPGAPETVLHFTADRTLVPEVPAPGRIPLSPGPSAFVEDAPQNFDSAALGHGVLLAGTVTIEIWAEAKGAAFLPDMGGSGSGFHWYNLVGSDRAFMPEGAITFGEVVGTPGDVVHVIQQIPVPAGGFVVEEGDMFRVLLTSLTSGGHDLLVGPEHPSQVRWSPDCFPSRAWEVVEEPESHDIDLALNRGLFIGQVPDQEGINQRHVSFTLHPDTQRLTIQLRQDPGSSVKSDMDLTLLDGQDQPVWRGGSPGADETMVMWSGNLGLLAPPGTYQVRVDAYSGFDYQGTLTIIQERTLAAA